MPTDAEIKAAAIAIREDFQGRPSSDQIEGDGEDGFGNFMEVARVALEAAERVRSEQITSTKEV